MNVSDANLLTLANGKDGRPVVISFEVAMKLREQGRAFVHKPASLQKTHTPAELMSLQGFGDDDNGPEAA